MVCTMYAGERKLRLVANEAARGSRSSLSLPRCNANLPLVIVPSSSKLGLLGNSSYSSHGMDNLATRI